jgi:hypothetical protein
VTRSGGALGLCSWIYFALRCAVCKLPVVVLGAALHYYEATPNDQIDDPRSVPVGGRKALMPRPAALTAFIALASTAGRLERCCEIDRPVQIAQVGRGGSKMSGRVGEIGWGSWM